MEDLRRANGGLVVGIHDWKYLASRASDVRASKTILERRSVSLERQMRQAGHWLDRLRLLALLALSLGVAGLWLFTLWVVMGCWLAARALQAWRESCSHRLQRVQRQKEVCHIELWHLRCRELYVPLRRA
jgi:hypothetical protein